MVDSTPFGSNARFRTRDDYARSVPVHCVWEITLGCDLRCKHCGSRAGAKRKNELTLAECEDVVAHLARLGTREVNLIGGEVYLRKDWLDIIASVKAHGMRCLIQSGGRNLTKDRISRAKDAGIDGLGISIDGLGLTHDQLRGVIGSFESAQSALRHAAALSVETSVNTQLNRNSVAELDALLELLISHQVGYWQLQLTVPMGNASDNDEIILQPHDLLTVMPRLAEIYRKARGRGVQIVIGNNIGYFGPYEHLWRGLGDERVHWTGCSAGETVIALESDGTVKGCPSLETGAYRLGNVRDLTPSDIWEAQDNRNPYHKTGRNRLKGFCQTCYYANVCKAGCTWMAHSLLDAAGDNPYCHYRALKLHDRGVRERVEKISDAGPAPFSTARYRLIQEPVARRRPQAYPAAPGPDEAHAPASQAGFLDLCGNCREYVFENEETCPHCQQNLLESRKSLLSRQAEAERCANRLAAALRVLEANSQLFFTGARS